MAPVVAPVQPRRRSTAQGRKIQYDAQGRPFRSEVTQPEGFSLSPPVAAPVAPFIPTVENPATLDQIARAFYGPSIPGAPPPPMTQAQYQARKAAGFPSTRVVQGGGIGMIAGLRSSQETLNAMRERAGLAPVQLGESSNAMSPETLDAVQALVGASPARQERLAMAGRAPATVQIDGQGYMPLGRPNYGEANRYQGKLSDDQVGLGSMAGGLGTTGGMGSGLMRGRLPASMENPQPVARVPMQGGGGLIGSPGGDGTATPVTEGQFQEEWNKRFAPWRVQQPSFAAADYPEYRNVETRGPDGELVIKAKPIVGGAPRAMTPTQLKAWAAKQAAKAAKAGGSAASPPVTPPPVATPTPTATPATVTLPPGVRPPTASGFPPGMGKPNASTSSSMWPGNMQGQAASAAPTGVPPSAPTAPVTPAAQPGFARRNAGKIGAGAVAAGGLYALSQNGEPVAPVLPVGPGQEQVYRSKAFGETTDPVVAQNRMAWDAEVARRKSAVQGRGIAKGEARDLRMGIASPEVVARAQLANNPNTVAAMYAAQQEAAARGAEPALLSQVAVRNTALTNLQQQWSAATTPEQRAAIEQQMQTIQSQPFVTPQGQTPQQFMQGTFGSPIAAPVTTGTSTYVRPVQQPAVPAQATKDTGPVPGGSGLAEKPKAPEETPPSGMTREQFVAWSEEQKKRGKDVSKYDKKINAIKAGRIPWEPGDLEVARSGTPEQAARVFVELYGEYGLTYEQALADVVAYRKEKQQADVRSWGGSGMKF